MGKENLNKKKRCPRCGYKTYMESAVCPDCGLVYERIQNLSNQRAKEEIKAKRKHNVIYVKTMPSDVNKKKFWLLFIFLGFMGAHNIYVGKYGRGYYTMITGILAILGFLVYEIVFFQGGNAYAVEYYLSSSLFTFYFFGLIISFSDSLSLLLRNFKYPATLTEEDYNKVITKKIRGK